MPEMFCVSLYYMKIDFGVNVSSFLTYTENTFFIMLNLLFYLCFEIKISSLKSFVQKKDKSHYA